MKLNKVIGAYLSDLGESIATSTEPICPMLLSELLPLLAKMEASKELKKDEPIKKEEMTPEECLACELMNMLGLPADAIKEVGDKPVGGIKIRIKKVSSPDELSKVLKELKNGGTIDFNTFKASELGEIFEDEVINLILETPMFKLGGKIEEDTTLEEFLNA